MQVRDESNEQVETVIERSALERLKENERSVWLSTVTTTLLGALLSLVVSAASETSVINLSHVRRSYVWFLGGIVVFQTLLIFVVWTLRKRNRQIISVKEDLIKVYLSAINRSSLNPNLESSEP